MSAGSVVIDYLPEAVEQYREGYAIVAIDVIRATTTAVTAAALGRRCFPAATLEEAAARAATLDRPLLVGELGGNMPFGFDLTNSPAALVERTDRERPMVLLSSSGTQLIGNAVAAGAPTYLACFRNFAGLAAHLIGRHHRVAVIGAGTRGEFREEDQMCCAWVAEGLLAAGYVAEDANTTALVDRWHGKPGDACLVSKSVDYLRRSDQLRDLEFILAHIADVPAACRVKHGEAMLVQAND